jgi:hypothetical protein
MALNSEKLICIYMALKSIVNPQYTIKTEAYKNKMGLLFHLLLSFGQ